jgi:hypothetical protein
MVKLTRKTPRLANIEMAYRSDCPTSLLRGWVNVMVGVVSKLGKAT